MRRFITMLFVGLISSAALGAAPAKVLLVPFEPIGAAEKNWVSKALQQNLLAELSRVNSVQPVSGAQATSDQAAALKSAEEAGAQYVIFGSYQFVETEIRITGQVIDVATKQPVAGLKATGSQRDLFGLEDLIAQQAKRALPQPIAQAQPEMLKQAEAQPPQPKPADVRVNPFDANQRARELEAQIDRAIERMGNAMNAYDDDSYRSRRYSVYPYGYYSPFVSYGYSGVGRRYCSQSNISVVGGYHGKNWNVGWNLGGGCVSGSNLGVTSSTMVNNPVWRGGVVVQHPGRVR